ncbi:MAG: L-threonylcarbamoyladenylate synthase [Candidatus Dormibacteria bacterium]
MSHAPIWPARAGGVRAAAGALQAGGVVAFPTDTVFGLAARADLPAAVRRISELKGRSPRQPLILMAAGIEELDPFCELGDTARELAGRFWPGPLTLILPARPPGLALGGEGTVGVRIPSHQLALELLAAAGPLATTSANRHGRPPVRDALAAISEIPGLAGALSAPAEVPPGSEPSSILDLTREAPTLVRRGRLGPLELALPGLEDLSGARRD